MKSRLILSAACAATLVLAFTSAAADARDMKGGGASRGGGGGMGGGGGVGFGAGTPWARDYDPRGGMGPLGYDPINPYSPGFTIHGDPSAFGRAAQQERKRGKQGKANTAERIHKRHLQEGQQNMQFLHNALPVDW